MSREPRIEVLAGGIGSRTTGAVLIVNGRAVHPLFPSEAAAWQFVAFLGRMPLAVPIDQLTPCALEDAFRRFLAANETDDELCEASVADTQPAPPEAP